jgi:hypothetical protein
MLSPEDKQRIMDIIVECEDEEILNLLINYADSEEFTRGWEIMCMLKKEVLRRMDHGYV